MEEKLKRKTKRQTILGPRSRKSAIVNAQERSRSHREHFFFRERVTLEDYRPRVMSGRVLWVHLIFYPPPPTPISRTIGRKYRDREMVATWSKVPNMVSGRTLVKSTIWSHSRRKYRIGILSRRAAKTGKKSWRETLCATGVKFRSEILCSIFRNTLQHFSFWNKRHFKTKNAICAKSANVVSGMEGSLHMSCLLQPVLAAHGQKFQFCTFDICEENKSC